MSDESCTRARRRHTTRLASAPPAPHRVPSRVTAKARAAFAWRVIELRLDQILAEEPPPQPPGA